MRKAILLLAASLLLTTMPPKTPAEQPLVSAERAVLMGPQGQILWERNSRQRCLIASTTKLMTALVVLDLAAPEDSVEIPAECCGIEGSSMYLQPGERCTVEELLCGLLLASGNDAAEALAVCCAGDEAGFVARMNAKAAELGMEDSHFSNPHGLDAADHYSTAADLGLLMVACMEQPLLAKLLGRTDAQIRENSYVNHNKLLWRCPGCLGGKTGYTMAAGRCLVSCCQREGTRLYCVTLSAPQDWDDHCALYAWGFARYGTWNLTENLRYSLPVYGGREELAELRAEPLRLFLPRNARLQLRVELPRFVLAPVPEGAVGGRVTLLWKGRELGSAALRFAREIPAEGGQTGRDG